MRSSLADPKRPKRIRASQAEWNDIYLCFTDQLCVCCGQGWDDLHHLLPRSQGGCDVRENLIPVCRNCHGLIEARNPWARMVLGNALTPENRRYLWTRIGPGWQAWLERHYGVRSL